MVVSMVVLMEELLKHSIGAYERSKSSKHHARAHTRTRADAFAFAFALIHALGLIPAFADTFAFAHLPSRVLAASAGTHVYISTRLHGRLQPERQVLFVGLFCVPRAFQRPSRGSLRNP